MNRNCVCAILVSSLSHINEEKWTRFTYLQAWGAKKPIDLGGNVCKSTFKHLQMVRFCEQLPFHPKTVNCKKVYFKDLFVSHTILHEISWNYWCKIADSYAILIFNKFIVLKMPNFSITEKCYAQIIIGIF